MSEKHEPGVLRAEQHGSEHGEDLGAPGGLAISAAGYALAAAPTFFEPGREAAFAVRILDEDGAEVPDLEEQHGDRMHLVVVPRDLSGYQHLHPALDENGAWTVPLTLPRPGAYRAFADFVVGGEPLTLGVDLFAPGDYRPEPLPEPASVTGTDGADGYEVALEAEDIAPGAGSRLVFRVSLNGRPVEDLEPYLGALGHLVALREGDLTYLHVHPEGGDGSGPEIPFRAAFPSAGRYRLFLQFAHVGEVRTAAFTVGVPS